MFMDSTRFKKAQEGVIPQEEDVFSSWTPTDSKRPRKG